MSIVIHMIRCINVFFSTFAFFLWTSVDITDKNYYNYVLALAKKHTILMKSWPHLEFDETIITKLKFYLLSVALWFLNSEHDNFSIAHFVLSVGLRVLD